MRIAYFTDTYYPEINGVTNTLSILHNYLNDKGIPHIFFAPEYQSEHSENNIKRYHGIPIPFSPNSRLALPYHQLIRDEIEKFQPDLIHIVTEFTIGNEGLRIAREMNIPLVTSYHTNIDQYLEYFHARLLERPIRAYFKKFHSNAEMTFCPSTQTYNQLASQGYRNLAIWSRGVDTALYSPKKRTGIWRRQFGQERFLCLYVGRLSYEKGLDYYLESIREINRQFQDQFLFVFAGDGPFRAELEASGIDNIILTGFVRGEMLAQLYADSDLFVFPSGTETFGNVLLEAMSSGCACICTNSGGVTDFSNHRENAWVIPYRSSEALTAGILKLMHEPLLKQRLSCGALKTAASRSWNSVMSFLTESYEEVLSGKLKKHA